VFEFKAITDYLLIRIYKYGIQVTDGGREEYIDFTSGNSFWTELDRVLSDENLSSGNSAELWQDIENRIRNHPKNWKTAFHDVIARFGKKHRRAGVVISVAEAFDVTEYNDTKIPGISSLSKKDRINLVKNDRPLSIGATENLHEKVVLTPGGAKRYISELTYLEFIADLIVSSGLQPFFIGYDDVINYNIARRHRAAPLYLHLRLCGSRIWSGAWEGDSFMGSRLFSIHEKELASSLISEISRVFSLSRALKHSPNIKVDLKGFSDDVSSHVRAHFSDPSRLHLPEGVVVDISSDATPTIFEEWKEISQDYASHLSLLPRNFFYFAVIKRVSLFFLLFTLVVFGWSSHFLLDRYQELSGVRQQAMLVDATYEGVKKSFLQKVSGKYEIFNERNKIALAYKKYGAPRAHLYPQKIVYGTASVKEIEYRDGLLRIRVSFDSGSNFAERLSDYRELYAQLRRLYGAPPVSTTAMERKIALSYASSLLEEEFEYELPQISDLQYNHPDNLTTGTGGVND